MDVVAIVTAAGKGERIGGEVRKQFILLEGKPILTWTLYPFQECSLVEGIICVVPPYSIDFCWEKVIRPFGLRKVMKVIKGGNTRQESVKNGLEAIDLPCKIVVIHDGVRPFISVEIIKRSIEAASRYHACTFALPVGDTIKAVKEGVVKETIPRNSLWQVQTPQAFSYDIIYRAHEEAFKEGFKGTDDASLVERMGFPVRILEGSRKNIKITTQEDLDLARAILTIHRS
jgi:2-C-methyl-D-erythritol 4-phosphate cytidylyltransferase